MITWLADGYRKFKVHSSGEKFYFGCLRLGHGGRHRLTRRVFTKASAAEGYSLRLAERYARLFHTLEITRYIDGCH
jgi:hypothetical protein